MFAMKHRLRILKYLKVCYEKFKRTEISCNVSDEPKVCFSFIAFTFPSIIFLIFIFREKKREREREELWKKLHDLENIRTSSKKSESTSDSTQHQQNNKSSLINSNPSSSSPSTLSTTNTVGGGTSNPYNMKKEIIVPKEE